MDLAQLDGISVVLGAIAAGSGDAIKEASKEAVTLAKDRLVRLVRGRLKSDPVGDAKLTVYAAEPTPANGEALRGHLLAAGVDQDGLVADLARQVLQAAGPAALAPGSVAATVISQVNRDGGTGFIGGQHVHHHAAPPAPRVSWELLATEGSGYELRNTGTSPALNLTVHANVNLVWPIELPNSVDPGAGVLFICSPSLSDPVPVVTVRWTLPGSPEAYRWTRPLNR